MRYLGIIAITALAFVFLRGIYTTSVADAQEAYSRGELTTTYTTEQAAAGRREVYGE